MRTNLDKAFSVKVFETEFQSWMVIHLTIRAERAVKNEKAIHSLFSYLYHYLKDSKAEILLEKVYGLSTLRESIEAIRNHHINTLCQSTCAIPFTYIGSIPCIGGKIAGVQMTAIIPKNSKIKVNTIFSDGDAVGRLFETPSFKEIYLSGISGIRKGNKGKPQTRPDQIKTIVERCRDILRGNGFRIWNIVRTWIYFPRILNWYKRFLKIRAKWFKEFGLMTGDKNFLPASTGIQGRGRPNEEVFLDLIGFVSKKKHVASISMMKSERQNEARRYGATFSRGVEIKLNKNSLLQISGTASINPKGETIYFHDEQGQITETLINLGALLETRKAHLTDIVLTAAYCKNRKTYETFKSITKYLGLNRIPFIPVYADICRDNLLFEIDAIAVAKAKE